MARLAATDFGADWVLNTDADEFWLPRGGDFRALFAAVPARYGVVRGAWRNFVPRPDDDRFFAERMTARLCRPSFHPHPLSIHFKSAHRAVPDVRVGRGNHEAFGAGSWPCAAGTRSRSSTSPSARSRTACASTSRSSSRSSGTRRRASPVTWPTRTRPTARASSRPSTRRSSSTTRRSSRASRRGELAIDTRLRDRLAALGFGAAAEPVGERAGRARRGCVVRAERRRRSRRRTSVSRTRRASIGSNGVSPASRDSAVARRDRAPGRESSRSFRPGARQLAAVRARIRSLLDRVARVADGEGTRHLGLPRVLPPALRLRPAARPSSRSSARRSRRSSSGLPLDLGGIWLLEVVFGLLYATSILAWSATALNFGRIPALFTRAAAARLSGVRDALPPGLERRGVRDRARRLGAAARSRAAMRPSTGGASSRVGAGIARARPDPPGEPGAPPARARAPLVAYVAWRRRFVLAAACVVGRACFRSRRGRVHNGDALRRHDRRARRTSVGSVPAGVHREQDDLARERRGVASASAS